MDLNFETLKKLNLQYPNNQDFAEVVRKMVWKKEKRVQESIFFYITETNN